MKRIKQDIISEKGVLQFRNVKPETWIFRLQPETDIGIDGELEIIKNSESTGDIIKVQIKGTETPHYIEGNAKISIELSVANVHYFCYELEMPVTIIVSDLLNKKTYWYFPQADKALRKRVKELKDSNQQNISVHISVQNLLPDTVNLLEEMYDKCMIFLSTRNIIKISAPRFVSGISGEIDYNTIIKNFQEKIDIVKIQEIEKYIKEGKIHEASKNVKGILNNTQVSVQTKFAAYLEVEKIFDYRKVQKEISDQEYIDSRIGIANKLKSLVRKGPIHLKYFSALLFKTAQLYKLAKKDYSLYLTWHVHQTNIYSLIPNFYHHRKLVVEELKRKYLQCMRLLKYTYNAGFFYLLPECTCRFLEAMMVFYQRLKAEKLLDSAKIYKEVLFGIISTTCDLAANLEQWDTLFGLSLNYIWLTNSDDISERNKAEQQALLQINKIDVPKLKSEYLKIFEETKKNISLAMGAISSEQGIEIDKQMYLSMAEGLGIDLNDPKDPMAQVVKVGIKDYNPERVLKNCRHLFVTICGGGLVAQILGLRTAGGKVLHCTLHEYAVEGMSLDMIYEGFKWKYCKQCSDKNPHPPDWNWTFEWQQKEEEKHQYLFKSK